jgi:3-oxoacyl-[acyl-carrier-protein] synthase-1
MAHHAPAEIVAIGMVTPVGLSAPQTAAAVRAGIGRLAESAVNDRFGAPLVMGLVDDDELPPLVEELEDRCLLTRAERLVRLAGPALREALAEAPPDPIPWLLGLREPRAPAQGSVAQDLGRRSLPGIAPELGPEILEMLSIQTEIAFDASCSRIYPLGRAAGLVALAEAVELLRRGRAPAVLVGAVDSYLDIGLLEALDAEGRLRTGEVSDGFVPGEGAAFLLLASAGRAGGQGSVPLARVDAVGRAHEAGHLYSEAPHRADGLAAAFHAALDQRARAGAAAPPIGCVYASLNGESHWAKEWGVAQIRCAAELREPIRVEHPVDCFGDAGAALGPIMLGLAALELACGRVDGSCLVWGAADRGERAAALLAP